VANRTGFLQRRDDRHFSQGRQRLGQDMDPIGAYSVVIGDKYARHLNH
jgi:hypothetical protein